MAIVYGAKSLSSEAEPSALSPKPSALTRCFYVVGFFGNANAVNVAPDGITTY